MPVPINRSEALLVRHEFVHQCFGKFYRGILDWVGDVFYPRIQYKVIGTYDKSVEWFNKRCGPDGLGYNPETNVVPSVTLDPSYDFFPAEQGGRFLWQSEQLAPGLGNLIFNSYQAGF